MLKNISKYFKRFCFVFEWKDHCTPVKGIIKLFSNFGIDLKWSNIQTTLTYVISETSHAYRITNQLAGYYWTVTLPLPLHEIIVNITFHTFCNTHYNYWIDVSRGRGRYFCGIHNKYEILKVNDTLDLSFFVIIIVLVE